MKAKRYHVRLMDAQGIPLRSYKTDTLAEAMDKLRAHPEAHHADAWDMIKWEHKVFTRGKRKA